MQKILSPSGGWSLVAPVQGQFSCILTSLPGCKALKQVYGYYGWLWGSIICWKLELFEWDVHRSEITIGNLVKFKSRSVLGGMTPYRSRDVVQTCVRCLYKKDHKGPCGTVCAFVVQKVKSTLGMLSQFNEAIWTSTIWSLWDYIKSTVHSFVLLNVQQVQRWKATRIGSHHMFYEEGWRGRFVQLWEVSEAGRPNCSWHCLIGSERENNDRLSLAMQRERIRGSRHNLQQGKSL